MEWTVSSMVELGTERYFCDFARLPIIETWEPKNGGAGVLHRDPMSKWMIPTHPLMGFKYLYPNIT